MKRVNLITGCNGQDGSYLSELLLEKGEKVYGMIRRSSVDTTERIKHILDHPNFELIEGDVTDATGVFKTIDLIKPYIVFNLAAQSHVKTSFEQPISTFEINAVGPLNILEAIRQLSPATRFYQASTSELYGNTLDAPQNEQTKFNPCSPYAVSKLAAHHTTQLYRQAYDIFACAGILFNHESPRRGENFVTRKITKYVAGIISFFKKNNRSPKPDVDVPKLHLGNLDARRDWSHARDMVFGMWLMMIQNKPEDFVLSSGHTHTIKQFLSIAFGICQEYGMDIGDFMDFIFIDPKFYRPVDVNLLIGDSSKAKRELNWKPQIGFVDLIRDMIRCDICLD